MYLLVLTVKHMLLCPKKLMHLLIEDTLTADSNDHTDNNTNHNLGGNDDHPDVRNNLGENSQPPYSQVQILQERCLSR